MTTWVVELTSGGACTITCDALDVDYGVLTFSSLALPVAVFPAKGWTSVRQEGAKITWDQPHPPRAEEPAPFAQPFATIPRHPA
jgi:hypothetical protein